MSVAALRGAEVTGPVARGRAQELAESVRAEGASTRTEFGHWGRELVAEVPSDETHRFIGVDGPRWMVRCVASGRRKRRTSSRSWRARSSPNRSSVAGADPCPPREPLPLILPSILAQQVRGPAADGRRRSARSTTLPADFADDAAPGAEDAETVREANPSGRSSSGVSQGTALQRPPVAALVAGHT